MPANTVALETVSPAQTGVAVSDIYIGVAIEAAFVVVAEDARRLRGRITLTYVLSTN